jgi:endonuclease G
MRKLLLIISILIQSISIAQKVDTIINTGIYKSYFCYKYKEPLYVTYNMYKGGGDCSREGFNFINDTKVKTATANDYKANGYDKGHLASSEDFASNCKHDEMTFRFYNCLPQTPNLNRGTWKHWETEIRKISQTDSVHVICGGIFTKTSKVIGNGVYVPDYCWKIVISLKKNKILYIMLFTNNDNAVKTDVKFDALEKLAGYKITLPKKLCH